MCVCVRVPVCSCMHTHVGEGVRATSPSKEIWDESKLPGNRQAVTAGWLATGRHLSTLPGELLKDYH